MQEASEIVQKNKRQIEEEHTPLWIKLFGGTIISITFLCMITILGYFVNGLNNLQTQMNNIAAEAATKSMSDVHSLELKNHAENIASCKERLNAIEQLAKERALLLEKSDARVLAAEKLLDSTNKDVERLKERCVTLDQQATQAREENRQISKDLQQLRERLAVFEGKSEKTP